MTTQIPGPEAMLGVSIDRDFLDFFQREGGGCQAKMNEVLRAYVDERQNQGRG